MKIKELEGKEHDLKNMLASLQAFNELGVMADSSTEREKFRQKINSKIMEMNSAVEELFRKLKKGS